MKEMGVIIGNNYAGKEKIKTVTVLPPAIVDEVSDEEQLDDDEILFQDIAAFEEVAGTLEYETEDIDPENEFTTKKEEKPGTLKDDTDKILSPKWTNSARKIVYDPIESDTDGLTQLQIEMCNSIRGLSPLELFSKFFDEEVLEMIILQTVSYAKQKNCSTFELSKSQLKRFLGILLISGYHTVPSIADYWSKAPSLGVSIVKQSMSRNQFNLIKGFLHVCDNNHLTSSDKFSKVPLLHSFLKRFFKHFFLDPATVRPHEPKVYAIRNLDGRFVD